jgi:hypothetical protein
MKESEKGIIFEPFFLIKVNCLERGINLTPKTGTDPFTPDQKKTLRPNEVRSTCGWLGSLKYYAHSAV